MKAILKICFALAVASLWFWLTRHEEMSIIFFFIVLFALFFKPFQSPNSAIRDQYIEKLKENIKKHQEVNEEFSKERNVTYKDFRKKEK
ncbi:hypothetical protein [Helicobacter pametensis]|uniref:hypothetical protein n=1 Tax=Helicobacter pametensis TaxID=95149 RepID=UPI0004879F89|nr:hypothetical protein [Helicobacter pametensis]